MSASSSALPDAFPEWLAVGARVRVVRCSRPQDEPYRARVAFVEWPWLVALEGTTGAVHPLRVLPDY